MAKRPGKRGDNPAGEFAERIQGRLDRLGLSTREAGAAAGYPGGLLDRMLAGQAPAPRGKRLVDLADALATSVSYLVGLDPDIPPPEEFLREEQGTLGSLLAGDEDTLLRAYRRLDVPARAALLLLVTRLSPEPVPDERKPRQAPRRS